MLAGYGLEEIREVEGREQFLAAFESFVDEYGSRAPAEIEFSSSRYRENPAPLPGTIRGLLESGESGDHREHVRTLEAEADAAIDRQEEWPTRAGSVRSADGSCVRSPSGIAATSRFVR